ncbi:MAG: hypothetical protein AB7S41_08995 [Parvibaculaceae bacterium]
MRAAVRTVLFGGERPFQISDIFGNGAYAGFDFTDLERTATYSGQSLMYNASTMGLPITASGNTVGLFLSKEKSAALGPELVTNGGFNADTDWTKAAGWSIAGGVATSLTTAGNISASSPPDLSVGEVLRAGFDITRRASGTIRFNAVNGNASAQVSAVATYAYGTRTTSATDQIRLQTIGTPDLDIDNVTVKRILGNHGFQTTSGSRPAYTESGALRYLNFDGTDDSLLTTLLPSSEMTLAVCWRPPSSPTSKYVIGGGDSTGGRRVYTGVGDGTNSVIVGGWGTQASTTIKGTTVVGGADIVSLFRANASIAELWLNGSREYQGATGTSPSGSTSPLAIGGWNNAAAMSNWVAAFAYRAVAVQRFIPDSMLLPLMRALGSGIVSF